MNFPFEAVIHSAYIENNKGDELIQETSKDKLNDAVFEYCKTNWNSLPSQFLETQPSIENMSKSDAISFYFDSQHSELISYHEKLLHFPVAA